MTDLTTAPVASDIKDGDITMLVRMVNGIDTLYQVPASVIRGQQGIQGIQGIQGPQGIQGEVGKRGSEWFSGNGTPSSSISANNNDMYIDLTKYDLYKYSNSAWVLVGNIEGPQGIRGSSWSVGIGKPIDNGQYLQNDIYLNSSNGDLYNYTTEWVLVGNIEGPQGIQGEQGIQGASTNWYYGNGSPNIAGNNGDKYLNTATSDVYSYNDGSWILIGNIRGQQGQSSTWYYGNGLPSGLTGIITNDKYIDTITDDLYSYDGTDWVKIGNIKGQQGSQGIQGIQGNVGPRGSIWRYGVVSPPTITDANLYDVYLDGITGNVYQFVSGSWVSIGNIRGPVGTFTNDGSDDILISSATLYDSGSLNFYSDGDNTTIDSSIIPSGGTSGTEYKGNLTLKSDTIIVSNKFSSDNGLITTDGSGNITFSNGKKINLVPTDTTQTGISLISGNSTLEILDTKGNTGNISVKNATLTGIFSSDNGDITSDGSGNLSVSGLTIGGNTVITENTSDSRYLRLDGTNYITSDNFTLLKGNSGVTGIEIGAPESLSYIDFHSYTSWNDYDARIISEGGSDETGSGNLSIIANSLEVDTTGFSVKGTTSLDDGKITTDGAGNLTAIGANFSGNVLVPAVTDWTKRQAVGAADAEGRYIGKAQGSLDYPPIQAGVQKSTGNPWLSYNDGSGIKYVFAQQAGDYATNTALNAEITNRTNADTNLNNAKVNRAGDIMSGTLTLSQPRSNTTTGQMNYTQSFIVENTNGVRGDFFAQENVGNTTDLVFRIWFNGTTMNYWWFNQDGRITSQSKGDVAFTSQIPTDIYTLTNMHSDFGGSGYNGSNSIINLPYGLRIVSFYVGSPKNGQRINYPVAFSNNATSINISPKYNSSGGTLMPTVSDEDASGFTYYGPNNFTGIWITAIGPK